MERIIFLVTIHSCNILTHPLKLDMPSFSDLFSDNIHSKTVGGRFSSRKLSPLPEVMRIPDVTQTPDIAQNILNKATEKPICLDEKSPLPLKKPIEHTDKWLESTANVIHWTKPAQNYKVLVASAPQGVVLNEETMPMSIYIVFNDDRNINSSPKYLPNVYFVTKSVQRSNKLDTIYVVDSNRTVTGLRSKEIEKFIRFSNKFTRRHGRKTDSSEGFNAIEMSERHPTSGGGLADKKLN